MNKFLEKIKSQYAKIKYTKLNDQNMKEENSNNATIVNIEKENYLLRSADFVMERYHLLFENDNAKYPSHKTVYPELTDDILKKAFLNFVRCESYDDAVKTLYSLTDKILGYTENDVKYDYKDKNVEDTDNYKKYWYHQDIDGRLYSFRSDCHFDNSWRIYNGVKRNIEEAAGLAAEKWSELLFNFHLNDNGALNEEMSFNMSLLSTALGEKAKEKITDDVKKKTFDLIKGYYIAEYNNDLDWCREHIPSDKSDFNWEFFVDLTCDYDPSTSLYLILLNAGVDKNDIHSICPWKTRIKIRDVDNSVIIYTYQKHEVL